MTTAIVSSKRMLIERARTSLGASKKVRGNALLTAIVAIAITAGIMIFAAPSVMNAFNQMNNGRALSDLDVYKQAMQQAFTSDAALSRIHDNSDDITKIINAINAEIDDKYKFEMLGSASGGVGTTTSARDPWGNPYGLYVFTNDAKTVYTKTDGTGVQANDSCVYVVVASAGAGGNGGPCGTDGSNVSKNGSSVQISNTSDMVCNTDGIDDVVLIMRILNGSMASATIGSKNATYGALVDTQWVFGKPNGSGGKVFDFVSNGVKTVSAAGSIDHYPDGDTLEEANLAVVGNWA